MSRSILIRVHILVAFVFLTSCVDNVSYQSTQTPSKNADIENAKLEAEHSLYEYSDFLLKGNAQEAATFIYPRVVSFAQKKFPEEEISAVALYEEGVADFSKLQKSGIKFHIEVDTICFIGTFNTSALLGIKWRIIGKKNTKTKTIVTYGLAIRDEGDPRWYFIAIDEEDKELTDALFGPAATIEIDRFRKSF